MPFVAKIVLTLAVFGLLIFVHELGHFLMAKKAGVLVHEFALGMGPRLFSFRKNGTLYSIRLLPIGGFVQMEGEDGDGEGEGSFSRKKKSVRLGVLAAGAAMNLILGFVLTFAVVVSAPALGGKTVHSFAQNATSNLYGLQAGDEILAIAGKRVSVSSDISYLIVGYGAEPCDVLVRRDGEKVLLKSVEFPNGLDESSGLRYGMVDFSVQAVPKNVGTVLQHTFLRTVSTAKSIWRSLGDLITGRYGIKQMSGPVGMTDTIGASVADGWRSLVSLVAFITINLGVMNLLPLPALDGGRILFLLIEVIRGKPMKPEYEGYINFVVGAAVAFNGGRNL